MLYVGFVEVWKRLYFSMFILSFCMINFIFFWKNYEIWMFKYVYVVMYLILNKIQLNIGKFKCKQV